MSKRCLLLVVLLCVVVGVQAESFSQQVMAQIEPMLQVSWPDTEFNFGKLSVGANETPIMALKVSSNIAYRIELHTESIYLKEFLTDLRIYGDACLKEALKVSIDGGVNWLTLENSMVLAEQKEISGAEDVYDLKYQQVLSFPSDMALAEGSIYKTDITLLITPAI